MSTIVIFQGPRPLTIKLDHIRVGVVLYIMLSVSHRWEFPDCIHSEKMTVSIISRWDSDFDITKPLPDMKEPNRIGKILPMQLYAINGTTHQKIITHHELCL